jgi:esterase/lipase superfamily enzyme
MGKRLLLFASALAVTVTVTNAQPSTNDNALACKVAPETTLKALEKRRLALEKEIARKDKSRSGKSAAAAKEQEQSLRKSQEELLDVIFQIDCLTTQRPPRDRRLVLGAKVQGAIEITTYYATNRKQNATSEPTKIYGGEVAATLQYGRAIVSIPPTHVPGHFEMPTLWKLERNADASQHFVLKSVTPLGTDDARQEMAGKLRGMGSKSLLVFVHGFKTGFAEAALRTAQLAHDLNFPGMAFFYSWPSANQVRSYWLDEEVARLSESVFERLIEELSQLPVTDIYVVAHSMGNRIVGHALQARADKGKQTPNLKELLLAAPDINAEVFTTVIAPKLAAMQGTHTTVYASSSDIALKASKIVHRFRRLGETTGGVVTYPGIDTIDASSASKAVHGFGHFYVVDSPAVITDIKAIIGRKGPAKLRGLSEVGAPPNSYWRFR